MNVFFHTEFVYRTGYESHGLYVDGCCPVVARIRSAQTDLQDRL